MKRLLFAALIASATTALVAQQRPLITEPANTVDRGHLLFGLGFEFFQDALFPFSGLDGDLSKVGVLDFRLGVSDNVELQLMGTAQNVLNVNRRFPGPNSANLDFNDDSTSDVGDFTLATKIRFKEENVGAPSLGFRFGFTMPNASNESGLGNDETGIFGTFLIEKSFNRARFIGNAGIVILGDPTDSNSQDDLFTYGLAALLKVTESVHLLGDFYGRAGDGGIGNEEQANVRLGAQIEAGGLRWDIAAYFGLHDTDPDTGFIIGISKDFELWP